MKAARDDALMAKWRIIKRNSKWIAYKRYTTPRSTFAEAQGYPRVGRPAEYVKGIPYVVPLSQNSFAEWGQAMWWALHDRRREPGSKWP